MQVGALYRQVRDSFRSSGVETPDLDAKLLVGATLGLTTSDLILKSDEDVPESQKDLVLQRMALRIGDVPIGRILGEREFYGRSFALNEATLEPRPDTEVIVDAVLARVDPRQELIVADIGTGTGAIAVTLLCELPRAVAVAVDVSERALEGTRANAQRHGVASRLFAVRGDYCGSLSGGFDWIVSNPPYIPSAEIGRLSPLVKNHDPLLALDGGTDGLDAYRRIAADARPLINNGGGLVLEHGFDQADEVENLLCFHGFTSIDKVNDLAGCARAAIALVD